MMKIRKERFVELRRYFFAGMLVLIPTWSTLMLVQYIFTDLDRVLSALFATMLPFIAGIPGLSIIAACAVITLIGFFATNVIGHRVVIWWDKLLHRIPLINKIYKTIQQITHVILGQDSSIFHNVILLEYPRKGLYSIAFVTSPTVGELGTIIGSNYCNIFVPTTPNPTSGFMIVVNKDDVVELEMSIEDAMKMVVSAGSVTPEFVATHLAAPAQSEADC